MTSMQRRKKGAITLGFGRAACAYRAADEGVHCCFWDAARVQGMPLMRLCLFSAIVGYSWSGRDGVRKMLAHFRKQALLSRLAGTVRGQRP
ncbi:hypothetical protein [Robbsia andropogonis]|uniref:hypothetical protein n=1 Tax=Robbsia andropogonis TaxID=28092 RepID=UPI002A6AA2E1|nr:hypothetical protein [Robbsia andropogonis]